jgi:hypothetical protein
MKRLIAAVALVGSLLLFPGTSSAERDTYDGSQAHPLRVAAYLAYPVGFAAEWLVFRPFHVLVSTFPSVFGHRPHSRTRLESN